MFRLICQMKFFYKIIISSLAVFLAAWILPGVNVDGYLQAILLAIVLSFLNAFIKPVFVLLTLPVTILSLGIFLIFTNTFMILLADYLLDSFTVNGFWSAFLFSIVLTVLTSIFESSEQSSRKE